MKFDLSTLEIMYSKICGLEVIVLQVSVLVFTLFIIF